MENIKLTLPPNYEEDFKLGRCLSVPEKILKAVPKDELHDIIWCSEESVKNGECPACEYEEVNVSMWSHESAELSLLEPCIIHTFVFYTPWTQHTTSEQIKLHALAAKQLT